MPPHPMAMGNIGPHPSNPNYNQYKFESDEHGNMRRGKRDNTITAPNLNNNNNNRRNLPQQTETNGKKKINNLPKPTNTKTSDHQNMDQLVQERKQLLAQLQEISVRNDNDEEQQPSTSSLSSNDKQSIPINQSNQTKLTNSQDDEGEEGEISESD
ncbi:unnamed protein product [Adineta steineri]|uniref:Uncharacterized protein n=1 Tax=Adineta steineri TaxID=433720 RepID=A0A813PEN7_9BILA|nr:unnamed protein product [Adineta steineri]